eukprot:17331-Heterococcus_DN1.PRE.6
MAKARMFIHPDIVSTQSSLEEPLFSEQSTVESSAAQLIKQGDSPAAVALLTRTSNAAAVQALATYQSLFELFVSKYHDGYVMETPDAEIIKPRSKVFGTVRNVLLLAPTVCEGIRSVLAAMRCNMVRLAVS